MKAPRKPPRWITDNLIEEIVARLERGQRVRRTLPDGGRLHVDRRLPFLCLYRRPTQRADAGTRRLVEGEAAFLAATDGKHARKDLSSLVEKLAGVMSARFGAFLLVEIWSAPDSDVAEAAATDDIKPTELRPDFVVTARWPEVPRRTVAALCKHLERVSILKQAASVKFEEKSPAHPAELPYLLPKRVAKEFTCHTIGIRVRPIYRDHKTGNVYPAVLHVLTRGLGRALKQAFFTYGKTKTNAKTEHYYALGRRAMVKAVWEVDRRLARIADSFDFLLQVTPVNAEAAWHEFRRHRFQSPPRFYYRPLAVEPAALKRRLYEVPIERIEDPTLEELFRQRQDELDRKITMLTDVGTARFLLGSRQVYSQPDARLLQSAAALLGGLSSRSREDSAGGELDAEAFAARAREEIEYYRARLPSFKAKAVIRRDIFAGLLCSGGNLLIGHRAKIPIRRVEALLQHEVGTHLLTYYNGLTEPFQQLHSGFAGYDALQEGLAVMTEYLVGGLSVPRLRMLAARVMAAHLLVEGASFVEAYRKFDKDYDFSRRQAYTVTMRAFRGGGLTKDAVYLRGLVEILEYLKQGGQLEPLFIGKIAADHIPLIRELQHRRVLHPASIKPRYLEMPGVAERLERLRCGVTLPGLVREGTR